jgi:hypothetical protein
MIFYSRSMVHCFRAPSFLCHVSAILSILTHGRYCTLEISSPLPSCHLIRHLCLCFCAFFLLAIPNNVVGYCSRLCLPNCPNQFYWKVHCSVILGELTYSNCRRLLDEIGQMAFIKSSSFSGHKSSPPLFK